MEKCFNLLDEHWILVLNADGKIEEVSLRGVFARAHELKALMGELPTQDVAVLRLLLAILYAIFTRFDERGMKSKFSDPEEAIEHWEKLWNMGRFPLEVMDEYFAEYRERFYLFHSERPFYQIAGLDKGTAYKASKLNGELAESSNKFRLFQQRSGTAKKELTFAEAARWLLHINAFDDNSAKPTKDKNKDKKLPASGVGWLGKLGLVCAEGDTLFETLMLNFSLLNRKGELWKEGFAAWELDKPRTDERTEVPLPYSQLALLTLQSRRLLLEKRNNVVTGYQLLGGDFFSKENAFSEQMTVWGRDNKDKNVYVPKRHDASRQMWRDFPSLIAGSGEEKELPGVVCWLADLEHRGILTKTLRMRATALIYGDDQGYFADDIYNDILSINSALLAEKGEEWNILIVELLKKTDDCVRHIGSLAADIAVASGDGNNGESSRTAAKQEAYFRLDTHFRNWLSTIKPTDDKDEKSILWKEEVRKNLLNLGAELIQAAGENAFVGRYVDNKKNGEKRFVNVSKAFMRFKKNMKQTMSED